MGELYTVFYVADESISLFVKAYCGTVVRGGNKTSVGHKNAHRNACSGAEKVGVYGENKVFVLTFVRECGYFCACAEAVAERNATQNTALFRIYNCGEYLFFKASLFCFVGAERNCGRKMCFACRNYLSCTVKQKFVRFFGLCRLFDRSFCCFCGFGYLVCGRKDG